MNLHNPESGDGKIKLTTTIDLVHKAHACKSGYKKLVKYLGEDYPRDKDINLLTILESNGVEDMLWCLRATVQHVNEKVLSLMAADFAESVLHIYEASYPKDKSIRKCIDTVRLFAADKATVGEVEESGRVAYASAYTAGAGPAYGAAFSAYATAAVVIVDAAAYAAYASYAASYASSRKEERKKQVEIIKKYLKF